MSDWLWIPNGFRNLSGVRVAPGLWTPDGLSEEEYEAARESVQSIPIPAGSRGIPMSKYATVKPWGVLRRQYESLSGQRVDSSMSAAELIEAVVNLQAPTVIVTKQISASPALHRDYTVPKNALPDYTDLTKAEWLDYAAERDLDLTVSRSSNKQAIYDAIVEALD